MDKRCQDKLGHCKRELEAVTRKLNAYTNKLQAVRRIDVPTGGSEDYQQGVADTVQLVIRALDS